MSCFEERATRRREIAPGIVALYGQGFGHKAIAKQLGHSPRIVRTVLIEQGVYRPGTLHGGENHVRQIVAATKARMPQWKRFERERVKNRRIKRTRAVADLPLFKPKPKSRERAKEERTDAVRASELVKYRTNIQFRLRLCMRKRMRKFMDGLTKSASTIALVGCSMEQFRQHLESKWKPGMTWDNHAPRGWHIDHIKPCASFDLTDPEQQRACFHWTNTQPLWWHENIRKGDKVNANENSHPHK